MCCKSSWFCHGGGAAEPVAPSVRESGDGDISSASGLTLVRIWRDRVYCSPVARESVVRARGFRLALRMRMFFGNARSSRVIIATTTSNSLQESSSTTSFVMRIPCQAATEGYGSQDDRSMASHQTCTVFWDRASTQMSLVSRKVDTSTRSERMGVALFRRFQLLVARAVVAISLGSLRATRTLPSFTNLSLRAWTWSKRTCSLAKAVPRASGTAKRSAMTNSTRKYMLPSLTIRLTKLANCTTLLKHQPGPVALQWM